MENSEEKFKGIVIGLAALAGGLLVKKLLEAGYKKIYEEDPPDSETDEDIHFGKVLAWTLISGIAVSATQSFIKRKGEEGFKV